MCGRFAFVPRYEQLRYQFHLDEPIDLGARYNIAPGGSILFLCESSPSQVSALRLQWGLIPFWVRDLKKTKLIANARAESLFDKPSFRHSIKSKRGIVPVSGFFEWHATDRKKQPYYFKQQGDEYLAMAALWDTWTSDIQTIHSCCLVTTTANELMSPIHHRMPVILTPEEQTIWMNNQEYEQSELETLLHSYNKNDLLCYAVTPEMNRASFNTIKAIEPLTSN